MSHSYPTSPHTLASSLPHLPPSPHLTTHLLRLLPTLPSLIDSTDDTYVKILEHLPHVLLPFSNSAVISNHLTHKQTNRIIILALYILQSHLLHYEAFIVPILNCMSELESRIIVGPSGTHFTKHSLGKSALKYKVIDYAIMALRYCPEQDLPALCRIMLRICEGYKNTRLSSNATNLARARAHEVPHLVRAVRVMRSELQLVEDIDVIRMIVNEVLLPVMQVNQAIYRCFQVQLRETGGSLSEFDVLLLLMLLRVSVFESHEILELFDQLIEEGALDTHLLCATLHKYREIIDNDTISQLAMHLVVQRHEGSWSLHMVPFFFREYTEMRLPLMKTLLVSLTEPRSAKRVGKLILKLALEAPEVLETSSTALEEALYEAHHYLSVEVVHCLCATLCILVRVRREHLLRSLLIFVRKQIFSSSERCQAFALICLSHLISQDYSMDYSRDILQLLELAINVSTTQLMGSFGKMPADMLSRHCFLFDLINFNFESALLRKHFWAQLMELYVGPLYGRIVPLWRRILPKESAESTAMELDEPITAPAPSNANDLLVPNSFAQPTSQHTVNIVNNPTNMYFDTQLHYTNKREQWEFVLNAFNGYLRMYLSTRDSSSAPGTPQNTPSLQTLLTFGFVFPFDLFREVDNPSTHDNHLFSLLSAYIIAITLCRLAQMHQTFGLDEQSSQTHMHVLFCVFLRDRIERDFSSNTDHSQIYELIFCEHNLNAALLSRTLTWCYENWSAYAEECKKRFSTYPLQMEELLLHQLQSVFHRKETDDSSSDTTFKTQLPLHFHTADFCTYVIDDETDLRMHEDILAQNSRAIQRLVRNCFKKAKYLRKVVGTPAKITLIRSLVNGLVSLNFCARSLCSCLSLEEKNKLLQRFVKLFFQLDNFELCWLALLLVHQFTQDTNQRRLCSILGIALLRRSYNDYDVDPADIDEFMQSFFISTIYDSGLFRMFTSKIDETCSNLWSVIENNKVRLTLRILCTQFVVMLVILCTEDDDITFFIEDVLLSMCAIQKNKVSWYAQLQVSAWPAVFVTFYSVLMRVLENMPLHLEESAQRHGQIVELILLLFSVCERFQAQPESRRPLNKVELHGVFEHFTSQVFRLLEENCELFVTSSGRVNEPLAQMIQKIAQFASSMQEIYISIKGQLNKSPRRVFLTKMRSFNVYLEDVFSVFHLELPSRFKSYLTKGGKHTLHEYFDECIREIYDNMQELTWERETHEENTYFVLKRVWRDTPHDQLFHDKEVGENVMDEALIATEMNELIMDQDDMNDEDYELDTTPLDDMDRAEYLKNVVREDLSVNGGKNVHYRGVADTESVSSFGSMLGSTNQTNRGKKLSMDEDDDSTVHTGDDEHGTDGRSAQFDTHNREMPRSNRAPQMWDNGGVSRAFGRPQQVHRSSSDVVSDWLSSDEEDDW